MLTDSSWLVAVGQPASLKESRLPGPASSRAWRYVSLKLRFGPSLNTHVHFHCCVVGGVFELMPGGSGDEANGVAQTTDQTTDAPPGVAFHPASGLDDAAVAQVQAHARKRILHAFVSRGLIEADDAKEMAGYQHGGGFSVDAGVCIAATDRAGLEPLLRYCARPPFAMERLRKKGPIWRTSAPSRSRAASVLIWCSHRWS